MAASPPPHNSPEEMVREGVAPCWLAVVRVKG